MRKFYILAIAAACFAGCQKPVPGEEPDKTVKVKGVELNNESIVLNIETLKTITLTASVTPDEATDRTVSWRSTRPDVATVEDGVVTAVAEGSTVIIVTTVEGEYTDECSVKVNPAPIPVTHITLSATSLDLYKGNSGEIQATVFPANADDRNYTWSSSDPAVATIENGILKAIGGGTTTIAATATMNGVKGECSVTVAGEGIYLNGVVWAERNVDAPGTFVSAPEEVGMLYKWGSKVGWSSTDPVSNTAGATAWDASSIDGTTSWPEADDPCPTGWRLPTLNDMVLMTFYLPWNPGMIDNKSVVWTMDEVNGVRGVRFTNMKVPEASVFFPTNGYRWGTSGALMGTNDLDLAISFYWASDVIPEEGAKTEGQRLYLSRGENTDGTPKMTIECVAITRRASAMSIRCVKKN